MAEPRTRRRWLTLVIFAVVVYVIVRAADTPQAATSPSTGTTGPATSTAPTSPSATASPSAYDPAAYAAQVRTRAQQADVSAQLVMAVLYNEAYKPHDPALERAWQKYKPDAAFGIANMHRATFDEVKKGRDFAGRSWDELPDDRDLAIEAEAWYLHDLSAQLPPTWRSPSAATNSSRSATTPVPGTCSPSRPVRHRAPRPSPTSTACTPTGPRRERPSAGELPGRRGRLAASSSSSFWHVAEAQTGLAVPGHVG